MLGTVCLFDTAMARSSLEVDMPWRVDGVDLHFRGRDNVLAVVEALLSDRGLVDATEVVLSGCSAGAVTAVLLADSLRELLKARCRGPVFVAALSDSGVFPEWQMPAPLGVLSFPQFAWLHHNVNASTAAPPTCLGKGSAWRCLSLEHALPHVQTPVFVLQSFADSWQLSRGFDATALDTFSERMHTAVASAIKGLHGGALDSCFHHCEQWGSIHLGNETNAAAFRRWYEARLHEWRGKLPPLGSGTPWLVRHSTRPWCEECCEGQAQARAVHESLTRW